ncbi:aminotransferase class I/II-fold pyridoxal phosphate-dependent enzyme [Corynebacterium amycolatum]|uniref:aminotransferase class I/II-fold pyridoxal phosphate-dependent enzyme n=1 Tax=Corynebacterium amycolatum TaxID=43765 RepID=UPI0035AB6D92
MELPADASSSTDTTGLSSDLSAIAARRNTAWAGAGLARTLRTFETAQLPHSRIDGADYLLFSSSDYLGLSTHPELVSAATEAIGHFGTGSGGSRLTTGTSIHSALESELAQFFGFDDAVLFATGYQANHSTIAAIATADVEIFSDAANHASIIDGCRNARAKVTVFPHADYQTLDRLLTTSSARHKLVISDSVFSMSGEVIDGPALERTCSRRNAWLMLDDAHGVGVIGEQGRGTAAHLGIRPDIVVGTASKALGVEGGYVLCSAPVGELLRNQARSYVYSTSMNPGSVAAIRAALKQLEVGDVVKRLQRNIARVRSLVGAQSDPTSAIIPLPVGDETEAMDTSAQLAELGVFIPAIRYPTVPRGEAMLRLTITALHTDADIDQLERALRNTGLL